MQIPFRADAYRAAVGAQRDGSTTIIANENQQGTSEGMTVSFSKSEEEGLYTYRVSVTATKDCSVERLFLRLGIDCYMEQHPQWNDKFFPTFLRCEKNGLWGCFQSPSGDMLAIASPSQFLSWKNEYNRLKGGDVGHRINTVSVDMLNRYPQPSRHPVPRSVLQEGECLEFQLYCMLVSSKEALFQFVQQYAGIKVIESEKYTLEAGETPVFTQSLPYVLHNENGRCEVQFDDPAVAQTRLYVRKPWDYYFACAADSAKRCQQKSGSNCESWYGYFSRVLYLKHHPDAAERSALLEAFDRFYAFNTRRMSHNFKRGAMPQRLQNLSSMISLLVDFFEATQLQKYLDYAHILAKQLMKLQSADGAYRSHSTHYTCVIYPAKSLLELALVEKETPALSQRYQQHFDSAKRAILNLYQLMDNIQTEGEMTFEDGMISCEALQLAALAMQEEVEIKAQLTKAAKLILQKHRCLEQWVAPDARVRGCTLRYWEARYDVNFDSNMLNSPHGWTSWKTYATYYLYLLTGELDYLRDTMDTMGACMQCVDDEGTLRWAYIADPCVVGKEMIPCQEEPGIAFRERVVGEEYLPMVSDWYRCNEKKFVAQYIRNFKDIKRSGQDYGGACDNDVHEHFKCLEETVFGKAFIHQTADKVVTYNCHVEKGAFCCDDPLVHTAVVYAQKVSTLSFNGKDLHVQQGMNVLNVS